MSRMVTSRSLGDIMVSTVAQNARDVGSIPALDIFITPMTLVAVIMILYNLGAAWLLNLPSVYASVRSLHVCV